MHHITSKEIKASDIKHGETRMLTLCQLATQIKQVSMQLEPTLEIVYFPGFFHPFNHPSSHPAVTQACPHADMWGMFEKRFLNLCVLMIPFKWGLHSSLPAFSVSGSLRESIMTSQGQPLRIQCPQVVTKVSGVLCSAVGSCKCWVGIVKDSFLVQMLSTWRLCSVSHSRLHPTVNHTTSAMACSAQEMPQWKVLFTHGSQFGNTPV